MNSRAIWEIIAFIMNKLHPALPRAITFLLIHNSCNYFPNCTRIHVITYTNYIYIFIYA